jgi:hypothetical protein
VETAGVLLRFGHQAGMEAPPLPSQVGQVVHLDKVSLVIVCPTTFGIITCGIMKCGIITFGIMTFSMITFSIMTFSITTFI